MEKRSFKTNTLITICCCLVFIACSLPCTRLSSIFTISEVRPAFVLNVLLGICLGFPAALGIAIGNLICDIINGYPSVILIAGFVPQFFYTYIPYLLWQMLTQGEDHIHRLDSGTRVLKFLLVVLINGFISGTVVGLTIAIVFDADFLRSAYFIFLNNYTFSMVLGCPLMILANHFMSGKYGTGHEISYNEKIIIRCAVAEIITIAAVAFCIYHRTDGGTAYDIWNTIYLYSTYVINVLIIFSIFIMLIIEKKRQSNL